MSKRNYPISPTGLAHIPRAWIHGGPDNRSLCNYLTDIWKQKWGILIEARRGCRSCIQELQKRVYWYEQMVEELGGTSRRQIALDLKTQLKEAEKGPDV